MTEACVRTSMLGVTLNSDPAYRSESEPGYHICILVVVPLKLSGFGLDIIWP